MSVLNWILKRGKLANKYKKFLVPLNATDFSFEALKEATILAKKLDARITGMFVIDYLNDVGLNILAPQEKEIKEKTELFLQKAKDLCSKKGVMFNGVIIHGEKGPKIVSYAKNNKFDLIVIRKKDKNTARELFFGSVSNYILHKSKIPVLTIH